MRAASGILAAGLLLAACSSEPRVHVILRMGGLEADAVRLEVTPEGEAAQSLDTLPMPSRALRDEETVDLLFPKARVGTRMLLRAEARREGLAVASGEADFEVWPGRRELVLTLGGLAGAGGSAGGAGGSAGGAGGSGGVGGYGDAGYAVVQLVAGGDYTCALLEYPDGGRQPKCWGSNADGKLGIKLPAVLKSAQPLLVAVDPTVAFMSGGEEHNCARFLDGGLSCWGLNQYAQAAGGAGGQVHTPRSNPLVLGAPAVVAGGSQHTCAATRDTLECWGNNGDNKLGGPYDGGHVVGQWGGASFHLLAAGTNFSCAGVDGGVACWGAYGLGQLGRTWGNTAQPALANLDAGAVVSLSAGNQHVCTVSVAGGLFCWGNNGSGQLGRGIKGAGTDVALPLEVARPASGWAKVSAFNNHTCGLGGGMVYCWGDNVSFVLGQSGTGSAAPEFQSPVALKSGAALQGVVHLATGGEHTCAATAHDVWCWGDNGLSQLGNPAAGSPSAFAVPVQGL